ncbi:MAG: hypothetical protein C4520_00200 [Candidatus Abyssobacteria bacterium SURF_5]|uniref:AsmA-like C-terminal domain-containing protein n=1 Tax=Abyssobacteria bacterium (strain SURF_5) TaxID=2093360 RepID=A0A3A4PFI2_ABYX5|nr:MAG: hypothetical protein C4520_00200 [Candidatus Abyssubacteria bacterium SURF_5]
MNRSIKIISITSAALLVAIGLAVVALSLALRSGELKKYVERRAEEATGLQVQMDSLHFGWPPQVWADAVSISPPEEEPILVAERLRLRTSLIALLRGQFLLLELVSPDVSIREAGLRVIKQELADRDSGEGFSFGLIRITDGSVSVLVPPVAARLSQVNATFRESILSGGKQILTLNAAEAQLVVEREAQVPQQILLKDIRSEVSVASSERAFEIRADIDALVTADTPLLALPPDFPIGLSLTADFLPRQNAVENAVLKMGSPLVRDAQAYGSVKHLDSEPAPNLRFTAELPQLQRLTEYMELLQRPEYEHAQANGKLRLEGELTGTFRQPKLSLSANVEEAAITWNGFSGEGIQAVIPVVFEEGTFTMGPGKLIAEKASLPFGKQVLEASAMEAQLYVDSTAAHIRSLETAVAPFGTVTGQAKFEFASGRLSGKARLKDAAASAAMEFLSGASESLTDVSMTGSVSLDTDFEAAYKNTLNNLKFDFAFAFKNGSLAPAESFEFSGLDIEAKGRISSGNAGGPWMANVDGNVAGFLLEHPALGEALTVNDFPFSLSGAYSLEENKVTNAVAAVDLGALGKIRVSGDVALASGSVNVALQAEDVEIAQVEEFISPALYELPEGVSVGGIAGIRATVEGSLLRSPRELKGDLSLELKNGQVASGDFVTAAGLAVEAQGAYESESPADSWRFDFSGKFGGFELLVQTYYQSFQETEFPFHLSGRYLVDQKAIQQMEATVGLADMGKVAVSGDIKLEPVPSLELRIQSEELILASLYDQVGRQVFSQASPELEEAQVAGRASGDLLLTSNGGSWKAEGAVKLADGRFSLPQDGFAADTIEVDLPFSLHSPGEQTQDDSFEDADFGSVRFKGIEVGPAQIEALDLTVAIQENALYVQKPAAIETLGGTLNLGEVRAKNLLGPSVEMKTSFMAEGVALAPLSRVMGLPELPGTLNALFPVVLISPDSITTTGTAKLYTFNGTITIDSIAIEQPFSPVRTFKADLDFDNIRLAHLTDVLEFGKITGIIEGTVTGLEVSQGQPAAFVADFETVETRRVPQIINFDAIENISILGTGRGFQAMLGRGLFSFIDEFRYDKIGFQTALKNDNFRIRGKVVRDDTEYFVKGIFLGPSINVINRNPGQTISFKSMVERISRIQRTQSEDANE